MKSMNVQEGNIDDIVNRYPKIDCFVFEPGIYYITDLIKITRKVYLKGKNKESVHIYQNNSERDGIAILKGGSGTVISGISIHMESTHKIALTVANVCKTKVDNCAFYGNQHTFTIYYAGPSDILAGNETYEAYGRNRLDERSQFINNVVSSSWTGDVLSFSLQRNGLVKDNILRGGKIAVYMCKKCLIKNNTVYDSSSTGIHMSLPCYSVVISKNRIYESASSGIKLSLQQEHHVNNTIKRSVNKSDMKLVIKNNLIYDAHKSGIELNDVVDCVLYKNIFNACDMFGIYALRSGKVDIVQNVVSNFKVATWIESCDGAINVKKNNFISIYPTYGDNIIKVISLNESDAEIKVTSNKTFGKILNDKYAVSSKCVLKQDERDYCEYFDEKKLYKKFGIQY